MSSRNKPSQPTPPPAALQGASLAANDAPGPAGLAQLWPCHARSPAPAPGAPPQVPLTFSDPDPWGTRHGWAGGVRTRPSRSPSRPPGPAPLTRPGACRSAVPRALRAEPPYPSLRPERLRAGRGRGGTRTLAPAPPSPLGTRQGSRPQAPPRWRGERGTRRAPRARRRPPRLGPSPAGGRSAAVGGSPLSPQAPRPGLPSPAREPPRAPPPACLRPGLILADGAELPRPGGKFDLRTSSVRPALGRRLGAWEVLPPGSRDGGKGRGSPPGGAKSKEEVTLISQPDRGGAPSGPSHPTVPGATLRGIFAPQARMGDTQDAEGRRWGHIQAFGLSPTSALIFVRVITGLHDRVRLLWMGMRAAHVGYNLQNSVPRGLQSSQFRCGYAHVADEELSKCPKSNASQRVFSSLVP
ncbi:hypothetical protein J1605_020072 [Eschrichtius robustus]|uniref:Basic proline-rich protein-like n=1 Tax=Eschrichtius robustus TaxID=9764 RepID=A0AB34HHD9_ESCRO|nr:hypothetical protein J1605_020072 [Eschrichtius robustus]